MNVKEDIEAKFLTCKSGDLFLTRRSERRYAERGKASSLAINKEKDGI